MYGAIIGDTVGSVYEFDNVKTKDFRLFTPQSEYTDDSIMTIAVASALLRWKQDGADLHSAMVEEMQGFGRLHPSPKGGYGGRFSQWLRSDDPRPYNSLGNGSAMRVSPCGLIAGSLEEALELARVSAEVTHNHPEGVKGAQAAAAAVYLARTGSSIPEIRAYISGNFYPLDRTLDEIRPDYSFDETCQGTVPEAITAFLESDSFEDAIRNAISLGGDSDTIGAITGAVAWAYYGRDGMQPDMQAMLDEISLPEDLQTVVDGFAEYCAGHAGTGAV